MQIPSRFLTSILDVDQHPELKDMLSKAASAYLADDYASAVPNLEFLVALGSPAASFMLGRCYEKARGVPLDYAKAIELYEVAAAANVPHALINLGWITLEGRGCTPDVRKALTCFERAALGGRVGAIEALAWIYALGSDAMNLTGKTGVFTPQALAPDYPLALAWAKCGVSRKNELCEEYALLLTAIMTPQQISDAAGIALGLEHLLRGGKLAKVAS